MRASSPLILRELATPAANPASGSRLLYVKSDGKVYTKNSAGVEAPVDAGGGTAAHASTHASGASDPVTPAAIGAATSGHSHSEYAASSHSHADAVPHVIAWKTANFSRTPGQTAQLGWETASKYNGFTEVTNSFIVPEAGVYDIETTITGSWDNWPCWLEIRVDGTIVDGPQTGDNQAGNRAIVGGCVARCSVDSVIEIWLGLHASATINFTGQTGRANTNLEIARIGGL